MEDRKTAFCVRTRNLAQIARFLQIALRQAWHSLKRTERYANSTGRSRHQPRLIHQMADLQSASTVLTKLELVLLQFSCGTDFSNIAAHWRRASEPNMQTGSDSRRPVKPPGSMSYL